MAKDFTRNQRKDFTIRKEILFESNDENEINGKEAEYICDRIKKPFSSKMTTLQLLLVKLGDAFY